MKNILAIASLMLLTTTTYAQQKTIKDLDNCKTSVAVAKDLLTKMLKTGTNEVQVSFSEPVLKNPYEMSLSGMDLSEGLEYNINIYVNALNNCKVSSIAPVVEAP